MKNQGTGYLYRGFGSCLLGITIFRGSFFGFYDTFKGETSDLSGKWVVAYLSGLFSGFLVYPMETIRKRKIISNKSINQVALFSEIVEKEGVRSLYRGFSLAPVQSLAGSAILLYFDSSKWCFYIFNIVLNSLAQRNENYDKTYEFSQNCSEFKFWLSSYQYLLIYIVSLYRAIIDFSMISNTIKLIFIL